MRMIHFPGVSPKGSAKPSPGTVRKDGEGLTGNITSLLCSDPTKQEMAKMSVMSTTQSTNEKWWVEHHRHKVRHTGLNKNIKKGKELVILFMQWLVRLDHMMRNERAESISEAALPAVPLWLVASMLPVTLVLLGLMNRRTTRNKCCLSSFGSTCTATLTSLCRDKSDTQVAKMVQVWVHDEVRMLRERSNIECYAML